MGHDVTIANTCFGAGDPGGKVGYIPLGPLYITAALEKEGYEVDFRDYLVGSGAYSEPMAPDSLVSFLEKPCDIIGVGCTGGTLPAVISALSILEQQHPGKTVILGGIGPTGAAEEIVKHFPFIDIVVKGEGEATIVEVVNALARGKGLEKVRGIVYRENGVFRVNPPRPWIKDPDTIPFPAYHKIDPADYSITGIASTRGCPFDCTFCDTAPFWGRRYRARSVANVIEEIRFLDGEYGLRHFEFVDDTFVLKKERVYEFCRRIQKETPGIRWTCCGRINLVDEEMMKIMADSGCTMVFYGMESGSDKILARIKKEFTRERAKEVIARTAEYFDVYVSFIWGFPFETMEDFHETIDCTAFVSQLGGIPWLFSLAPLPLSSLYREYRDTLVFSEEWCANMAGSAGEKQLELLKKFPRIFCGFYRYDTENFREKFTIIKERGLMEHGTQTVFLDGLIVSKWE
jgi:radical SAM superfamily enzyme YgiQ (UPF0313 family)